MSTQAVIETRPHGGPAWREFVEFDGYPENVVPELQALAESAPLRAILPEFIDYLYILESDADGEITLEIREPTEAYDNDPCWENTTVLWKGNLQDCPAEEIVKPDDDEFDDEDDEDDGAWLAC